MLKVVFRDYVDTHKLDEASKTMDILNELVGSGYLSSTKRTLLRATIEATEQKGLLDKIGPALQSCTRENLTFGFSKYRLQLIKLGLILKKKEIKKIRELYEETHLQQYKDGWKLILDLEHSTILQNDNKTMKKFKEKLQRNEVHRALKALEQAYVISGEDFRQLLVDFSGWYDDRGHINMLKVVFRDHVKNSFKLDEAYQTMDILNELIAAGHLSSKEPTLLLNTG
ncbi:uncharacterized protein LOC117122831 [Anneissia japonica]|uniref:uncharacterized protein LOC117122831 n=1 Tax=Anneissia japonica TaxID=1529436 RepID=UPI001425A5FA|nr:uncharacterized protein LOC117122831 [Anneissia japonica]